MIWLNAEAILLSLKQDPEVAHLAALYLKYAVLGLPAYAFNGISRRYFQSQGTKYPNRYLTHLLTQSQVYSAFRHRLSCALRQSMRF